VVVFVIDDDVRVRQALCEELRSRVGHDQVQGAGFGAEVTERTQQLKPEVLFLDLSSGSRFEMTAYPGVPPAVVALSSNDHATIRELQSLGLNAWMKPEVFLKLDEILLRAARLQHYTDRLWDEWIHIARRVGNRMASHVLAFDGPEQLLVAPCEVLAGKTSGRLTELALASRVVRTPYPLDLISNGCWYDFFRCRAVIARHAPLRGVLALLRLYLHTFRISRLSAAVAKRVLGATIVDNRDYSGGFEHAPRNRK
jgi:hypothetical protein